MRNFKVGYVYSASLHNDGIKVVGKGFYHFKILDVVFEFIDKPQFYLAIKVGMDDYSNPQEHILAFNTEGVGSYHNMDLIFTLKKKLPNKTDYKLTQYV
jgi:hypothetical protein